MSKQYRSDAESTAALLVQEHQAEPMWLDAFARAFDRARAAQSVKDTLAIWELSQADAARLFGVTRQAVGKWQRQGVPAERAIALADLAAANDLLLRYLKRDRVAAVVRRPMLARGGLSLLDLLKTGRTREVLEACRAMFQFERASGERAETADLAC